MSVKPQSEDDDAVELIASTDNVAMVRVERSGVRDKLRKYRWVLLMSLVLLPAIVFPSLLSGSGRCLAVSWRDMVVMHIDGSIVASRCSAWRNTNGEVVD